mgnify:CR=1 FL=1
MADPGVQPTRTERSATPPDGARPWIGVFFACSNEYLRVHRTKDGSGYIARCRTCGKMVRFRVGQGGSNARFFEVSC